MEEQMPRPKFALVEKPAAQHEAEMRGIGDDLSEIASQIELVTLAVIGLGEDLDDTNGDAANIAGRLRCAARDLRRAMDRISPYDMVASKRELDRLVGEVQP
jgi:hypothetical protein